MPKITDLSSEDFLRIYRDLPDKALLFDPCDTAMVVWGWSEDGRLVHISDAPHARYTCLDCGELLEAVHHKVDKRDHFRHSVKGFCSEKAGETLLHLMAKAAICEDSAIAVPKIVVSGRKFSAIRRILWEDQRLRYSAPVPEASVTCPDGTLIRPDVTVQHHGRPVFIEIRVHHAVEEAKANKIRFMDVDTIEIDLSAAIKGKPYAESHPEWRRLKAADAVDNKGRIKLTKSIIEEITLTSAPRHWIHSRVKGVAMREIEEEERPMRVRAALSLAREAMKRLRAEDAAFTSTLKSRKVAVLSTFDLQALAADLGDRRMTIEDRVAALKAGSSQHHDAVLAFESMAASDAERLLTETKIGSDPKFRAVGERIADLRDAADGFARMDFRVFTDLTHIDQRIRSISQIKSDISEGLEKADDLVASRREIETASEVLEENAAEILAKGVCEEDASNTERYAAKIDDRVSYWTTEAGRMDMAMQYLSQRFVGLGIQVTPDAVTAGLPSLVKIEEAMAALAAATAELDACRLQWEEVRTAAVDAARESEAAEIPPPAPESEQAPDPDSALPEKTPERVIKDRPEPSTAKAANPRYVLKDLPHKHPLYGTMLSDGEITSETSRLIMLLKSMGLPDLAIGNVLFCSPTWLRCDSVHDGLAYPKSIALLRQRSRELFELAMSNYRKEGNL